MASKRILIVDDEELICWSLKQEFEKEGFEVFSSFTGNDGLDIYRETFPDITFLDINLPDKNGIEVLKEIKKINSEAIVIIITAYGEVKNAVEAIKGGAYDYIEKPFELSRVKLTISRALETAELKREVTELQREKRGKFSFDFFIKDSENMIEVINIAKKVASSNTTTVLIEGESGTGKDLLAKIIHYESSRASKPFIEINCSALPETLIESELFGFEKGSFTDAKHSKKGLFELADGGTVYMDEIGDVKLSMQVKLLKVLEEKTFKHIGGDKDITADVRVIAATNKDLKKAVENGNFREDLFYRLKVIPIYMPPLRERKKDIIPIAKHFILQLNNEFKRKVSIISKDAEKLLINYQWPGNVRELRNSIERAMILNDGNIILPGHLPLEIRRRVEEDKRVLSSEYKGNDFFIKIPEDGVNFTEVEKELIKWALSAANNNKTKAAQLLKMSRDTLRYRIEKLGI